MKEYMYIVSICLIAYKPAYGVFILLVLSLFSISENPFSKKYYFIVERAVFTMR